MNPIVQGIYARLDALEAENEELKGQLSEIIGRLETLEALRRKPAKPRACIVVADFDTFWAAYPRKEGKAGAVKWWQVHRPDCDLLAVMLAGIERLSKSDQWQQGFIPHATTFLNGKRWEDEPLKVPGSVGAYRTRDENDYDKAARIQCDETRRKMEEFERFKKTQATPIPAEVREMMREVRGI